MYTLKNVNPSLILGGGGGDHPPPWCFFLITQEHFRVLTWNFAPVTKIYLETFVQNFRVTWPLVADVSTFCDTWLTKKIAFFRIFRTLIASLIQVEKHWNFVNLFIISWITFLLNIMTSPCHVCILQTRNWNLPLLGIFWAITSGPVRYF